MSNDTLKQIADNYYGGDTSAEIYLTNNSYLNFIASFLSPGPYVPSDDVLRDILVLVGGDPATSTDYIQDIVLALGGTEPVNGNWMEAWEAITATPAAAPVNTVAPDVTGANDVGSVLTTTDGTWTGNPTSYAYQWKRGATDVGDNANTYTLVSEDAGLNMTCVVTATNANGSTPATSNIVTAAALSAPENLTLPTIDGFITWVVGDTLSFTGNEWSGNPVPVLTYQWMYNSVDPIEGATNSTLLTTGSESETYISVKCSATNSQGSDYVLSNEVYIEPE